jgi:hypothetical protein
MRPLDELKILRGLVAADRWRRDEPRMSGDASDALEALAELAGPGLTNENAPRVAEWLTSRAEVDRATTTTTPPRPEDEPKRPKLGAVADGQGAADLIPVLYSTLEDLSEESALEWAMLYPYSANWDRAGAAPDMLPPGDEPAEALADLFARLNYEAPTFCYFGSQGGTGPFGFWLDRTAISEAIHDGDLITLTPQSPGQPGYLLLETDDDVALFELTKKEVFSHVE